MDTIDAEYRESLMDAQRALVEAANLLEKAATLATETRPEVEETLEEYTTAIDELRREFEIDVLHRLETGLEERNGRHGQ
jgi:uncharacterized protein with PIN domain